MAKLSPNHFSFHRCRTSDSAMKTMAVVSSPALGTTVAAGYDHTDNFDDVHCTVSSQQDSLLYKCCMWLYIILKAV